jgi:chromosome segregation ATPase
MHQAEEQLRRVRELEEERGSAGRQLVEAQQARTQAEVQLRQLDEELAQLEQARDAALAEAARLDAALTEAINTHERAALEAAHGAEELRAALEIARKQAEIAEPQLRDLRNEVEGLKRRLKMEKDRHKDEDAKLLEERDEAVLRVERLGSELETLRTAHQAIKARAAELDAALTAERDVTRERAALEQALRDMLEAAQAELKLAQQALTEAELTRDAAINAAPPAAPTLPEGAVAVEAALFGRLSQRVDTLQRVVDAIERCDITPLGTVDRIRLQSALRDTAPARTLSELRELLAAAQRPQ